MFNENFRMRNFWIVNDIAYAVNSLGLFVIDFNDPVNISEELFSPNPRYLLSNNYPNPFNPATTIRYELPERGFVTLKVFDVLGNEVATLVNQEKPAGSYQVEWNAFNLPSGIYFYRMRAGNFTDTKKLILLK